jgi:predicted MFS family arabinose efflux permease
VIGLLRLVQTLGFTLPALLAAHYIHGRESHKRFLLVACAIGRVGIFALPPLLYYGGASPGLTIGFLFVVIAVFWLLDGGVAVSWFDIVAKTIPPRVRGRFFGVMQLGSGIASLGAAAVVTSVLQRGTLPFPRNFALLAAGWCVMLLISQVCLALIREPPGHVEEGEEKPTFGAYLRMALPLLRSRPRLRHLIFGRVLLDGAGMALPFYVLYAEKNLEVGLTMVGLYVFFKGAGKLCTGPVWGWLSDHSGASTGLKGVAWCIAVIPILALLAGQGAVWLMPPLFFLIGAMSDGLWMTSSNALLETVEARERPLAVGVSSLCQAPGALFGLIGGLLAKYYSYEVVFYTALLLGSAGLLVVLRLKPVGHVGREIVVDP